LLTALNSLFREVKALAGADHHFHLHDFLTKISTLQTHGLKITMEDLNVKRDAVRLSTVHKAKGQEWAHVFIAGLNDGKWGNSKRRELIPLPAGILTNSQLSDKDRNEDDRRLFYVAMTRAKQSLTLTYPDTVITNNHSTDKVASVFLTEIDQHLTPASGDIVETVLTKADDHLAKLLTPSPAATIKSVSEQEFFTHLVSNFSLSVTALNTYLRDPQDFVQKVLLKVPRAKPEPMAFGTAVHSALEKVFNSYLEEQRPPALESILDHYEQVLKKELLTSTDFDRRLAYGKDILTKYLQQLKFAQIEPLYIERFFGTGWSRTMLDDIKLVGRIDRVDWLDKASKTVKVIDYKTGQAKSANEIEGKTLSAGLSERELSLPESIRGPYKRQLLFYKLLTELDKTFVPTVTTGVFEFVEPNDRGKFVSRSFDLLAEDVTELKKLIKEVMAEIKALKFISN
jgi:DNA helicase-2/ATP-dependent DNA helicase PcrA